MTEWYVPSMPTEEELTRWREIARDLGELLKETAGDPFGEPGPVDQAVADMLTAAVDMARDLDSRGHRTNTEYPKGCVCIACNLVRAVEKAGLL